MMSFHVLGSGCDVPTCDSEEVAVVRPLVSFFRTDRDEIESPVDWATTLYSLADTSLLDFSCRFTRFSGSENASSSLTMCLQSHSIISGQVSSS